ncbi:MAG: flavodoxin [candidate division Zixibacteria bacterium HGW-Zixibacteria-1]|nr:MAG: flavodoxin [candidate division Zixibacteria bacterium HGW-Zixibacteria-1]
MSKIGIFYGSTTTNTIGVVATLTDELSKAGFQVDRYDVADGNLKSMNDYNLLILATPTWSGGELQDDWKHVFEQFESLDFTGKRVALLGIGDQLNYPDHFADAIAELADCVYLGGGQIVGRWPTDGYKFRHSAAVEDDLFIGLVVDQYSEKELTAGRIRKWTGMLRQEFAGL